MVKIILVKLFSLQHFYYSKAELCYIFSYQYIFNHFHTFCVRIIIIILTGNIIYTNNYFNIHIDQTHDACTAIRTATALLTGAQLAACLPSSSPVGARHPPA